MLMTDQKTFEEQKARGKIGLILLAAGESARLGQPKQLLVHNGKTLLQHSVEVARVSVASPVIIVLGANAARIKDEMFCLDEPVVVNSAWKEGMASSIRCGVNAFIEMNPSSDGIVLMVCDQPYVSAAQINHLIAVHYDTGSPVVASAYAGTVGPPTLFHKNIFPELLQLTGDAGARSLLNKHRHGLQVVPFPGGNFDIDTAEDVKKLQRAGFTTNK